MVGNQEIRLSFEMGEKEGRMIREILGQILNIRRISISLCFVLMMTAFLFSGWKHTEAVASLVLFSGCISLLFLLLLFYAYHTKPKLLESAQRALGTRGDLCFREDGISVRDGEGTQLWLSYQALRGQYWFQDYYILYMDDKAVKALLPVAIGKHNFDDIFTLANILSGQKKRLVRIKTRNRGKERTDEGKNSKPHE